MRTPVFLFFCCTACNISNISLAQSNSPEDTYRTSENNLSNSDKQDLEALRKEGTEKGWTFQVGATTVFAKPLSKVATTKPPQNILAVAEAQNKLARRLDGIADESALAAGGETNLYLEDCDPNQQQFDWKTRHKVTPVRYQDTCGGCWSFTAASAYEASYLIRNGFSVDSSEQHIINCSRAGSCEKGGFYDKTFKWMISNAVADERTIPFANNDAPCDTSLRGTYRTAAFGYVTSKRKIPLNGEMKKALCRYGPLAVSMTATPAFQAYISGVFNEDDNNSPPNHAVTIVGWDDIKGSWLVKNSWSEHWGEQGYVWMKYRTNSIGYGAAWVRPAESRTPLQASAITAAIKIEHLPDTKPVSVESIQPATTGQPKEDSSPQAARIKIEDKRAVWIHFSEPKQREIAEKIRVLLRKEGYLAPEPENVGRNSPKIVQVRYYTDTDSVVANQLSETLKSAGIKIDRVVKRTSPHGATPLEVWLPRT